MSSIKKVKKLLNRYPVIMELHCPANVPFEELNDMRKYVNSRFGNSVILLILPLPSPQFVIKSEPLNEGASAEFKKQWDELQQNHSKPYIGIDLATKSEDFSVFDNQFKIHSCFKLSAKQHKELVNAVKDHKVFTSIK